MKNILFFCNTYYQLITAIQIKLTLKANDRASVIITDHSANAKLISDRLRNTNIFDGVYFFETKVSPEDVNLSFRIKAIKNGFFGKFPNGMNKNERFDELIGFNMDLPTHYVFASLWKKNKNIICNRMEEGLLSYRTPASSSGLLSTLCKLRSLFRKPNIRQCIESFYCFNPEIYTGDLCPIAIPRIDKENPKLRDSLEYIFLSDSKLDTYTQKYIFLSCIYDIDGDAPIGELELAKKIADTVGKENLLVKVHPRDDKSKYEAAGLTVDKNSSIPWEVVCIEQDFSQHVFITTLSGSILNVSAMLASAPKSFYGYPLCQTEKNMLAVHFKKVIEDYTGNPKFDAKNIKILYNIDELYKQKGD